MSKRINETVSFVVRFTQKIFEDKNGEANVQWRGKISHVQGSDQKNFIEFEDALKFIQEKLDQLTIANIDGKTDEEKEGILTKSWDIWNKMSKAYPKMVLDAIKDPKAQVSQIQEQIAQVSGELSQKIEIDSWRPPSKADYHKLEEMMGQMSDQMKTLNKKLDDLSKKKSK